MFVLKTRLTRLFQTFSAPRTKSRHLKRPGYTQLVLTRTSIWLDNTLFHGCTFSCITLPQKLFDSFMVPYISSNRPNPPFLKLPSHCWGPGIHPFIGMGRCTCSQNGRQPYLRTWLVVRQWHSATTVQNSPGPKLWRTSDLAKWVVEQVPNLLRSYLCGSSAVAILTRWGHRERKIRRTFGT